MPLVWMALCSVAWCVLYCASSAIRRRKKGRPESVGSPPWKAKVTSGAPEERALRTTSSSVSSVIMPKEGMLRFSVMSA